MTYLMSISIGPVQDFINTARRSRDLWFSSWLLSELSKAAADKIVDISNPEHLIFPNPEDPKYLKPGSYQKGKDFNVVNKILAIVSDPVSTAELVEIAIYERLKSLADDAFKQIKADDYFDIDLAFKQINDLPEFYWAAYPLADPTVKAEYIKARAMVESMLTARKNSRNFEAVSWGDSSPKSSMDGHRETVIKQGAHKKKGASGGYTLLELRRKFGLSSGSEQLCGVGMLKRLGEKGKDSSFFSTSHVAALPWLNQLKNGDALNDYIDTLKDKLGLEDSDLGIVPRHPEVEPYILFSRDYKGERRSYDGHLLFEGQFGRIFDRDEDQQKLEVAKKALHKFLDDVKLKEPLPYYAILLADGDRMGDTINYQESVEQHRQLSRRLSQFATAVRDIIDKDHHGWCVYAGGDDTLAFVPLHKLIECARALADKFTESFSSTNNPDNTKFVDKNGDPPTLSMGIAIVHHLEPLSDALSIVRRAEKEAKAIKDKNALAVILSKRSGAETLVKGHWNEIDVRLQRFTYFHCADAIPDGAAYDLQTMERDLRHIPEAIPLETKRILKRKRAKHGTEELSKSIIDELTMSFTEDYTAQDLAQELFIARLLAKAMNEAAIKPEELPGAKLSHQEAQ